MHNKNLIVNNVKDICTKEFNVTGDSLANSYLIQGPDVEKYINPVTKSVDIYYKNDRTK